jgi:hypothetical protein
VVSIDVTAVRATAGILFLRFVVVGCGIYFLPTIIALAKKKRNTMAIALVNVLLGWSVIGWIV